MEPTKMPKVALHFMDHDGFAQIKSKDGEDNFHMVAYGGGVIKRHWYWGNLAIDLSGMSFPKSKYPILESHETRKKIAFAKKPDISKGTIEFNSAQFVDTEASEEFRKLSKSGFPYEASIYAIPSSVEKVSEGEKAEVNGRKFVGPGSIWRKATFKEASVCVFGHDSNTKSAAFSNDEIEVALETLGNARGDQSADEKEIRMDFEKLSKEHPELITQITENVTKELADKFAAEKAELEDQLAQERNASSDIENQFNKKLAGLEKREVIRRENELKFEAKEVWASQLSSSDIPERLHEKVQTQVSYDKFVKEGILDRTGFAEAVKAEVEDWESRGATATVMGSGFTSKEVEDGETTKLKAEVEADDALADEIFSASGGDRRKEVK